MKEELLRLIQNNSRIELKDLATMLGTEEATVANMLQDLEQEGTICGYYTLINWDNTDEEKVDALIEVNVNTQRDMGFDAIAERIYKFDEVKFCYLISGRYDFLILLEGKTMRQVANFVSSKLSPVEFVSGTATHFIMKRYKDYGAVLGKQKKDERERMSF
ncbi:MAG: Lrp/AsnC family transcriptional regulator [Lachnospiraceae bacterium]|nr:Lrp/AsnC family transcriptional regulator [Lachnospiraceae bacterium]